MPHLWFIILPFRLSSVPLPLLRHSFILPFYISVIGYFTYSFLRYITLFLPSLPSIHHIRYAKLALSHLYSTILPFLSSFHTSHSLHQTHSTPLLHHSSSSPLLLYITRPLFHHISPSLTSLYHSTFIPPYFPFPSFTISQDLYSTIYPPPFLLYITRPQPTFLPAQTGAHSPALPAPGGGPGGEHPDSHPSEELPGGEKAGEHKLWTVQVREERIPEEAASE